MSSSMKLCETNENELEDLITKTRDLPHLLTIHGLLSIGFRRNILNRNYSKIYIPLNKNLPFFIVITGVVIKNRPSMTLYWNPEEISRDVARKLLLSLPGWNWEEPFIIHSSWTPTLLEIEKIVMGENGISNNKLSLTSNYGYCYTLDKNSSSTITLESGFQLAPLTVKDAELVHKNWVYNHAEDIESIRRNLECLPSIAAYDKIVTSDSEINIDVIEQRGEEKNKENSVYKPISWALAKPFGEIGYNFTYPEYRSKGLSGAVTEELTKLLLEDSITPFVNITGPNLAAIKAVEKIGFRKYSPIGYQMYMYQGMQLSDF